MTSLRPGMAQPRSSARGEGVNTLRASGEDVRGDCGAVEDPDRRTKRQRATDEDRQTGTRDVVGSPDPGYLECCP